MDDKNVVDYNYLTDEQKNKIVDEISKVTAEYVNKNVRAINVKKNFYNAFVKRFFDVTFSGVALVVSMPINGILLVGTFIDVGSPVFFKQERIGKNGKIFKLVKFRNMTNEKDSNGVLLPPELRVTKWGKFVRKTSLDELLNFWSIFKGDMSIIGPRPLPVKYGKRFSKEHYQRHLVKPGLECPFIKREYAENGWKGRFDNDLWYVENISFKTDAIMVFKLAQKVFSRKERAVSASGQEHEFVGYDKSGNVISSINIPREYIEMVIK